MQNKINMKEEEIIRKHMKESNPFRTPDGYFDSFNSRLMQRIAAQTPESKPESKPTKVVSIRRSTTRYFRYAAAAVIAGVCITAGTYLWNKDSATTRQTAAVANIDNANEDYIDAALDYEMINNNQIAYYLTEAY